MKLKYGQVMIEIDDEDWARVKQHNWYATKDGMRTTIKRKGILLARYIMKAEVGDVVSFGSRGRNCYCKTNLTIQRRADFGLKNTKGATCPGINRGIYPTIGGRFAVRFAGCHLGVFSKIEDARHAYWEAYNKKYPRIQNEGVQN